MATSAPARRRSGEARERRDANEAELQAEFSAIYEREYRPALGVANRRLQDRRAAEDVVQTVFAEYWKGYVRSPRHVFRMGRPKHVRASILAAVRNRCRDVRKGCSRFHKNTPALRSALIDQMRRGAFEATAPSERELRITEHMAYALDALTEQRRNIWMAVKFDDNTYEEVAAKNGITVSTVRQTVIKAADLLRQAMVDPSIQEEVLKLVFDSGDEHDDADEYGEIDWRCTEDPEPMDE